MAAFLLAGLLVAHGGIHLLFVTPRPPARPGSPAWPFDLHRSWLFDFLRPPLRAVGGFALGLVVVTLASDVLAALATLGVLSAGWWDVTVAIGALSSLALLVAFLHPRLLFGIAIDLVLLWVAVVAAWTPDLLR